jgi:hypothetical protein
MGKDQRPEADVNIEYRITSKYAEEAMQLARKFQFANEKYATDYPANIGPHMTNTDSGPAGAELNARSSFLRVKFDGRELCDGAKRSLRGVQSKAEISLAMILRSLPNAWR